MPLSLSPEQRSQRARIGGFAQKAKHDPKETTRKARQVFNERFYAGIPADLPPAERDRRAEAARRAYFARLAFESSRARRKVVSPR